MSAEVFYFYNDGETEDSVLVTQISDGELKTIKGTPIVVSTGNKCTKVAGRIEEGWEMSIPRNRIKMGFLYNALGSCYSTIRASLTEKDFINFRRHNGDVVGVRHVGNKIGGRKLAEGKIIENKD